MTQLKRIKGRSGWWIVDFRDGLTLTIAAGDDHGEAQVYFHKYQTRRELEKEGYSDLHQVVLDKLWGKIPSKGVVQKP